MKVRVLFFAQLRERAGTPEVALELPAGATVADLRGALAARWPALAAPLDAFPVVVGGRAAGRQHALADGDEVVWLPPVAGGAPRPGALVRASLGREPLDAGELARAVSAPWAGAVVAFAGTVRDHEEGRAVERLEYEAYEAMAAAQLCEIGREALARWPEARIALAHRTGALEVGETSVVVAVAAPHRADAFECCRHLIERLKRSVPIWKRSFGPGGATWVEGAPYEEKP